MYRKIILFLLCSIVTAKIFAQQQPKSEKEIKKEEHKQHISDLIKREEEGSLIYNKQSVFGFKLNTDGWTVLYEHGKYKPLMLLIHGLQNLVSAKAIKKKELHLPILIQVILLEILLFTESKMFFIT